MFDLTGKTALVTGATGGIGGEIAKALHGAGATVGISGRNEDKLNALASALGDRVHVLPADLSTAEGADALVKSATEAMEKIDILVNRQYRFGGRYNGQPRSGQLLRVQGGYDRLVQGNGGGSCQPRYYR